MVEGVYGATISGDPMGNTLVENLKVDDVDGDGTAEILDQEFALAQADAVLAGAGAAPARGRAAPGARSGPTPRRRLASPSGSTRIIRWKLPSPTCPNHGIGIARPARCPLRWRRCTRPGARSARRRRWRSSGCPASAAGTRNRRRGAPATGARGPPAASPTRSRARRARGDLLHLRRLLLRAARRAVELQEQRRRFAQAELGVAIDRESR